VQVPSPSSLADDVSGGGLDQGNGSSRSSSRGTATSFSQSTAPETPSTQDQGLLSGAEIAGFVVSKGRPRSVQDAEFDLLCKVLSVLPHLL